MTKRNVVTIYYKEENQLLPAAHISYHSIKLNILQKSGTAMRNNSTQMNDFDFGDIAEKAF